MSVQNAVLDIVLENKPLSIERIRRMVSRQLLREVSWPTIDRHVRALAEKGHVKRHVISRHPTKSTIVVSEPELKFS